MTLNGKVVSSSGSSHNETRGLINNQPKLLHFISSNFLLLKNVEIYWKGMHVRATDDGRITRKFLNHAACLNQTYKRSKKKILIAEHKGEKKSSIIRGIFSNLYLIIVPLCHFLLETMKWSPERTHFRLLLICFFFFVYFRCGMYDEKVYFFFFLFIFR